jgi:hypothetical protein
MPTPDPPRVDMVKTRSQDSATATLRIRPGRVAYILCASSLD